MMSNISPKIIILLACVLISLIAGLNFGPANLSTSDVFNCLIGTCQNQVTDMVIWQVRIPRVLVALVAGMGLAIAG
jgi:iron complex transport system permease protein